MLILRYDINISNGNDPISINDDILLSCCCYDWSALSVKQSELCVFYVIIIVAQG